MQTGIQKGCTVFRGFSKGYINNSLVDVYLPGYVKLGYNNLPVDMIIYLIFIFILINEPTLRFI